MLQLVGAVARSKLTSPFIYPSCTSAPDVSSSRLFVDGKDLIRTLAGALAAEFLALKHILEPVIDLDLEVLLLGPPETRVRLQSRETRIFGRHRGVLQRWVMGVFGSEMLKIRRRV